MTELVPYTPKPIVKGGRLSFLTLAARLTTLTAQALALKEGLYVLKHRMEKDAKDADRIAEMCAEAEVEPRFTSLITEAATALRKVAEAAAGLAAAADQMESNARAFRNAHDSEYRGVYEAVRTSGVRQAKPGFYRKR
ncbi:conjugal transfer protein TraB [Streptomyces sp. CSDS2]|uniref:conjugal transfer protein TraB n=1 Tax=Streptomyces sp. CSDS2 TaxID=3055051 RepID=UPI0025B20132|nr:conjugal transfer protein TraB [Streptomyces sp. CSDS2]MDN3262906.1 conjugal transfer protein TraB [Streptomyces sp. CSDS2]